LLAILPMRGAAGEGIRRSPHPPHRQIHYIVMTNPEFHSEPARSEIDALQGPALIEFGTNWCGHCRAAQRPLAEALAAHPCVRHIKVEDGRGCRLGRTFGVKLWPTLVFLRDGAEVARLVRPPGREAIADALARIDVA
jgi:thioredoxin 1